MLLIDFKDKNISKLRLVFRLFFCRGSSAVFLYRISNIFYKKKIKPLAVITEQLNYMINHCDIACSAEFGEGLTIYHPVGVVIVGGAKVGKNCGIYQNVTIGKNIKPNKEGRFTPIIGDNVNLYSGCVVGGSITIEDNVSIGANAVILKDVPKNTTVIGAKATFL